MSHTFKKKNNNELSFDGMMKFYGNIFGKIKEGREKKMEKRRQQEEFTNEPNSIN